MYDFLADLDEYFCQKYANYDKLCVLPGYKTPVMQASKIDEFGRSYAYTLPMDTMRLALQENKTEILAALKEKLTDETFSFSFYPVKFFGRIKNVFSRYSFHKALAAAAARQNTDLAEWGKLLNVPQEVWTNICKGKFLPTKNLILSLSLAAHLSFDDCTTLLNFCGEDWNYTLPKDVVISYLLHQKIYGESMIEAALNEYKIRNLFMA